MAIDSREVRGNLLVALHKWARQQDENFTTEAFVHLLTDWVHAEPRAALAVLTKITADRVGLTEADCRQLEIRPQKRIDGNQPDIRIVRSGGQDFEIII